MSYLEKVKKEYGDVIEKDVHLKRAVLILHLYKDVMKFPEILTEVGYLRKTLEKYLKEYVK